MCWYFVLFICFERTSVPSSLYTYYTVYVYFGYTYTFILVIEFMVKIYMEHLLDRKFIGIWKVQD